MKVLDNIESRDTGKRVCPLRPIPVDLYREVESDTLGPSGPAADILTTIRHSLVLQTQTLIPDNLSSKEENEWIEHNERKVRRMFAESLYGDVRLRIFEILRYVHENHYDKELETMLDKLMGDLV